MMYEELNCFEEALKHFGTRVEVICAMELSKRLSSEDAYQMIKDELKEVIKEAKGILDVENVIASILLVEDLRIQKN